MRLSVPHTFTTLPALALSAYLHPSTREENSPVSAYSLSLRPRTFFCVHTVILDIMMSFPVDASSTCAGLSNAVGGQHAAQHICKQQRARTKQAHTATIAVSTSYERSTLQTRTIATHPCPQHSHIPSSPSCVASPTADATWPMVDRSGPVFVQRPPRINPPSLPLPPCSLPSCRKKAPRSNGFSEVRLVGGDHGADVFHGAGAACHA